MNFTASVVETNSPDYSPLMHPIVPPKEMQVALSSNQRATKRPEQPTLHTTHFQGYVVDEASGWSLSGVLVEADPASLHTLTNARGFFQLDLPIPSAAPDARETLVFSLPGYASLQKTNILLVEDTVFYSIRLHTGTGVEIRRESHVLDDVQNELKESNDLPRSALPPRAYAAKPTPLFQNPLPYVSPPDLIRVGTSCTTKKTCVGNTCTYPITCAHIYPISLEDYVATGVTREWLPNWPLTAIEAGAVAYRSYGAYYAQYPMSYPLFDICNTDSCQRWEYTDGKIQGLGLTAAEKTRGFMLSDEYGSEIVKSEYSSVNNDFPNPGYCYKNSKKPQLRPNWLTFA
jgi:hypothetical protein